MATQTDKRLRATAYHEAGHAVVMWELRSRQGERGFEHVTIVPNEEQGSLGHCRNVPAPSDFHPDVETRPEDVVRLQDDIVATFAGTEAEKRYTGRYNHVGADSDYHHAVELADYLVGSNEECEALLRWLMVRTRALVAQPHVWAMIEALAAALLEHPTMTSEEAVSLFQTTLQRVLDLRPVEVNLPDDPGAAETILAAAERLLFGDTSDGDEEEPPPS